ncbi:MAG: 30S ribosomal protein S4 [Rickettsiaceae bacterium]|nr:30S ribosomal protein S4 [Rickettsiaceae bacterium]
MSKVLQAKHKLSRCLQATIWDNTKNTYEKRNYKPGQHGPLSKTKLSDYGLHLQAKQRLKAHYGGPRITEKQFRNLFALARSKKGNTENVFIGLLESRLDVVIYRLGIAKTIFAARQIVGHSHVKVNGKKLNIPSYRLKIGDIISLKDASRNIPVIQESVSEKRAVPEYLSFDSDKMEGQFLRMPHDLAEVRLPFEADIRRIVELYSH